MPNISNELGFGSLASVAWSDMKGTDLTAEQLQAVNADISADTTIAAILLELISGSVIQGRTSFRLADLGDAFQFTNLNDAQTPREDNANDWAEFISRVTDEAVSASTELSLGEWRRVAAELQNHASQQASKRDPDGEGGGIKAINGNWFINGQEVSLLDAYMAVRVNQVANFDDSLNIYINELNATNTLIKAANEWLALLRAKKPAADDVDGTITAAEIQAFVDKWDLDPIATFHQDSETWNGGAWTRKGFKKFDSQIDTVKGFIDGKDTDNQTVQQKLEQMTNRRSEVLDGLTSFAKSQTQTGSVFSRNLG